MVVCVHNSVRRRLRCAIRTQQGISFDECGFFRHLRSIERSLPTVEENQRLASPLGSDETSSPRLAVNCSQFRRGGRGDVKTLVHSVHTLGKTLQKYAKGDMGALERGYDPQRRSTLWDVLLNSCDVAQAREPTRGQGGASHRPPHALLRGRFDRPPLAVRRVFLARQSEFGSYAPVYQFGEAATKLSIKDVFDAVRALTH